MALLTLLVAGVWLVLRRAELELLILAQDRVSCFRRLTPGIFTRKSQASKEQQEWVSPNILRVSILTITFLMSH